MSSDVLMPWLPPPSADWGELYLRAETLAAGPPEERGPLADLLRRLARVQLSARDQLKLGRLAKRLLALPQAEAPFRRIRVGFAGNRNLSFLAGAMAVAGLGRGLLVEAVEAPYGALQPLAHGAGDFFGGPLDAVVVVFDEGAITQAASVTDTAGAEASAKAAADLLERLANTSLERYGASLIVATTPEAGESLSSADWTLPGSSLALRRRLNDAIAEGAAAHKWLLWDLAELAGRVGYSNWFDAVRYHLAKAPFRVELSHLAADHLCALLAARFGKSPRAVVLDLDNTLWGGVIGDDGLAGIRLGQGSPEGEAYTAFQQFLLRIRDRGLVLAACSKNTDAIAREPFRRHPDMVLKEQHFAVFQANWNDKATNVAAIAGSLNLGLDTLVFVDDNPAERARVRQELPSVIVPEIGEEPAEFVGRLAASRLFEHLPLTAEDMKRADSYGDVARRLELTEKLGNYDDYLKSLGMRLAISAFDEPGLPRIVQLINKSNQFNLTTRRYSEKEVRELIADPDVLTVQARLTDQFSDHGMIAVVIARRSGETLHIDTWLQSCRILERGVEGALMNYLMSQASAVGAERVIGEYIATPRNGLVSSFYDDLGFEPLEPGEQRRTYVAVPPAWPPRTHHIELSNS